MKRVMNLFFYKQEMSGLQDKEGKNMDRQQTIQIVGFFVLVLIFYMIFTTFM